MPDSTSQDPATDATPDEAQLSQTIQALFQRVEALLLRPDLAALISAQSAEQLQQIRQFARGWESHSRHLSLPQKRQCLHQLTGAVAELTRTVDEFDQVRLRNMPVEEMAKA